MGAKSEVESYKRIAAALEYAPQQFLFISDAVKELDSAQSAGMQALLCDRDSRATSSPTEHVIGGFDGVLPE
jgi:methionine salvage enolase-phosphatase E1